MDKEIAKILELYKMGRSLKSIAIELDISETLIRLWIKNND